MRKYKLGDIATVEISGVDKKIKDGEKEIRLCNFVDVYYNWAITTAQHDSFMLATARPNEISKFKLKKGQVALTKDSETRDDIGIPTYIADDFDDAILGYHCALVTPNKDILDGRYLNALLHTDYAKKYFACNASGSGQRYALSVEALNSFPVPIIPLHEQKRIGEIFSALDKKIELNKRINQNLEAMAKQLYDYWFVQFDFPNKEGKPYKSSGGEMLWNEKLKREIPKGWESAKLDNLFQVVADKAKKMDIQHLLYAPIEVLPRKQMSFYDTAPIENAMSGLCKFKKGNILLSNRRVYFHKVCIAPFDGVTRDTVIVLKILNGKTFGFDYQIVNSELFISYATKFSYGSEQPVFSWQDAKNYYYAKPNNGIAEIYSNCVAPLINKVLEVQNELKELTKQRDELLPLLMNGQVSVNSDLSHD